MKKATALLHLMNVTKIKVSIKTLTVVELCFLTVDFITMREK